MSDLALSVTGVGKRYLVFDRQWARLRHALLPSAAHGVREVHALRDVNLEVTRGQSVGIIGRNGSGKTTLLEIIAGTLTPTTGSVSVNGRLTALLELGSGFNPEYSGRENVFLSAMLLGLSRAEVERRYADIVAFADIGDVLSQPVRTYSTGMLVRLAFAVQVALEPDILIVDEALSVGDFFFQQKCFGRLREMRERGLTLLFVSHDMGTVRDLCQTALYLRGGEAVFYGDSKSAVRAYLSQGHGAPGPPSTAGAGPPSAYSGQSGTDLAEAKRTAMWSVGDEQEANRRLLAVQVLGVDGQPCTRVRMGDTVRLRVWYRTPPDESGHLSVAIKNRYDQVVANTGTYLLGLPPCSSAGHPHAALDLELGMMLEAGEYSLMAGYGRPTGPNRGELLDQTDWFGPVSTHWDYAVDRAPFLGMFGLPTRVVPLAERP
jgi:lipopolysaccharide transport system ATP-binding protein